MGSLGLCGEGPHIGVLRLRQLAIPFKVQVQPLEESFDAREAIAASLEGLDFVVEALHETTATPLYEVVDDLVQPVVQRFQEGVETG